MEWITVCGVRFWGESQLQEGIWMSRGLGALFFLSSAFALGFAVHAMVRHCRDWLTWAIGPALVLLAGIGGYAGYILFANAACYAAY